MRVAWLAALFCAASPQAFAQTTDQPSPAPSPATATPGGTAPQTQPQPGAPVELVGEREGVIVFRPDYFVQSRPNTALDMIGRLPGFQYDEGASVRGLAGTAGNVLVDGKHPASKSDSLGDILSRIPANQVDRLELIRGGAPGIDMQGRTVVVNVVRKVADSFQQTLTANAQWFLQSGRTLPGFRYEATRKQGPRSWDFAFGRGISMDDSPGNGIRLRRDRFGNTLRREFGGTEADGWNYNTRGSLKTPLFGGDAQLNGTLTKSNFKDEDHFSTLTDRTSNIGRDSGLSGEIGANYDRDLTARWEVQTVLLQKLAQSEFVSTSENGPDREVFTSDVNTGESVARGVLRFKRSDTLSFEGGAEAALNFREGHVAFAVNGAPVAVPNDDVRVEERRVEAFVQANWRPTPTISIEAGSRFESSTISQSGDTSLERSFFYPKPRLLLSWAPNPQNQYRLRIEREVGQLSFGDFISSANLDTDTIVAGNPDLEPWQAWVVEGVAERRFWDKGAIVFTLRHENITDVIDRLPFQDVSGAFFDSPGNIGAGVNNELELDVTLPLQRLGVPGGELKVSTEFRDSEVTDPTTKEKRRISGQRPDEIEIVYRHDLPSRNLTFQAVYFHGWEEAYYRFNEIQLYEIRNYSAGSVEWKPNRQTALLVELANIGRFDFDRRRLRFEGPRNTSPLQFDEHFRTRSQQRIVLRLRRTIGQ